MATYKLRPQARDDLRDIRRWIARDSPVRARTFIIELTEHFMKIAELSLRHRVVTDLGPDVRIAVHGNYNIYYRFIGDSAEDVLIIRVLHGGRSLDDIIFG